MSPGSNTSRVLVVIRLVGLVIGIWLLSLAGAAHACLVCVPHPDKTAADVLIDSATVILAREHPDKPFSYAPVEVLKGQVDEGEIDLLMDSATRRILAIHPERAVVLVQKRAGERWRNLGLADADFEGIVRQILAVNPPWQPLESDHQGRLTFLAPLLGHENPGIRELAYLEVGCAPYGEIRRLSAMVSRGDMRAFLRNDRYLEWHALFILMLAHTGHAPDRAYIAETFHTHQRLGIRTNLAAWATAYIEVEEGAAVSVIEERYFRNPTRSTEELVEVMKALSVHGSDGHTHLRDRIVDSYGVLLDVHPAMASYVAKDLLAWQRWDFSGVLGKILEAQADVDPLGAYMIDLYVSQAKEAQRSASGQASSRSSAAPTVSRVGILSSPLARSNTCAPPSAGCGRRWSSSPMISPRRPNQAMKNWGSTWRSSRTCSASSRA
jgi:hypothetical protein